MKKLQLDFDNLFKCREVAIRKHASSIMENIACGSKNHTLELRQFYNRAIKYMISTMFVFTSQCHML
jgi:hypothetical protein